MAVQLPDFASVGVINPQPNTPAPVFPQNDAVAEGEGKLGQGIEKAGGTIEDVAAYSQMAKNRMDRASADADFTARYIPLIEKIRTETDPAKITELSGQLGDASETASQAIGDPSARELWLSQNSKYVARGLGEAQIRQTHVYNDKYKAGVIGQADNLSRTGAVASDPTAFSLARDNIGHLMQSAQDAGALTAVEAENYGKAATKQLIEGRALNLVNGGNPAAAKSFLEQHSADLDPITSQNLQIRLENKVDGIATDTAANRALGMAPNSPVPANPGAGPDQIDNWETQHNNFGGMRKVGVPAAGPNAGGFQAFDTPEAGVAAISHQLDRYASGATTGQPLNTLRGIVSTWAPPSENDTAALIARASQVTGFAPDQQIDVSDPAVKAKLIEATIRNEQGGKLPVDPALITQVANAPAGTLAQNRTGLPALADLYQKIQTDPTLSNDRQRDLAFNKAKVIYGAMEADAARSDRIQAAQQKQALEQRTNEIYADVYSAQPKTTASQIATDPAFNANPERRKAMIELINNPPGSGVPAAQSYAAAQSLIDRIRLPYGDPNKITTPDEVYGNIRSLNRPDLDFVLKTLDNSVSPGREKFNAREKAFLDGIKPQIDKSGIMPGLPNDGRGRLKFYEFQNALDGKVDQYIKAGKDPGDLLDPSKPDYMGKDEALKPYKRSMTQALADFQSEMGGEAGNENKPPVSAVEITATGPNGQKAALRGGQWVDVQTGKPLGGEPQPQAPIR